MTLLRFHLDCTDCGSIPKGFHTCPWQFLRIATTVYRVACISYFFLRVWESVWVGRAIFPYFPYMSLRLLLEMCSIIGPVIFWSYLVLWSCGGEGFSIKTWPGSIELQHASTILESLEMLNLHQPSSTFYGGNLSNLETEILKETLCVICICKDGTRLRLLLETWARTWDTHGFTFTEGRAAKHI